MVQRGPEFHHAQLHAGQRDAIAQLVRMQYARNEQDFSRGKFRVRGDTIDVFPAEHSELAIRIELFDDEVESLAYFDPLTGSIQRRVPRLTIYPKSHYVTPRDTIRAAVEHIREELGPRLAALRPELVRNKKTLPLSFYEVELLRLLVERANQPVSRSGHDRSA